MAIRGSISAPPQARLAVADFSSAAAESGGVAVAGSGARSATGPVPGLPSGWANGLAKELAARLGVPVIQRPNEARLAEYDLLLAVTAERLELRSAQPPLMGAVYVDLLEGHFGSGHRRSWRDELLGRAVGMGSGPKRVLDATAGLGRDAALLITWGCQVALIERDPLLLALLEDGVRRVAAAGDFGAGLANRIELHPGDAIEKMQNWPGIQPQVVYLDPMFEGKRKGGQVKRELQLLQRLQIEPSDTAELLRVARAVASERVVVKRHRRGEPLGDQQPSFQLSGRSTRFDIYLTTK